MGDVMDTTSTNFTVCEPDIFLRVETKTELKGSEYWTFINKCYTVSAVSIGNCIIDHINLYMVKVCQCCVTACSALPCDQKRIKNQ